VLQGDDRVELEVRVVHAAGDDDLAFAVNVLGADPGHVGAFAVHHFGRGFRRDDAGEGAVLGGEGVEQAVEQLGLGVLHGEAEGTFAVEVFFVEDGHGGSQAQ
jgi:hypothetical protein